MFKNKKYMLILILQNLHIFSDQIGQRFEFKLINFV